MENQEKKCFILMPISDQEDYPKGHFTRVYHHLLKPACEEAGFNPIRADDETKANYIVIDIIRKIIESDLVLCDLSSKNPNVLYELGIRQAFNLKSVLIQDKKTSKIFDIQGLRTIEYDENLRVDEVENTIKNIANTLNQTYKANANEVNSLVQLLAIKPADIPANFEISEESSLIMDALTDISSRISELEKSRFKPISTVTSNHKSFIINGAETELGEKLFDGDDEYIGRLIDVHEDAIFVEKDDEVFKILKSSEEYPKIDKFPF